MLNSFIMNKKWTFRDKTTGKVVTIKMLKFIITNIVIKLSKSYLLNSILFSKVLATICAQVINYFSYKCIVFGINKQKIIRK